MAKEVEHKIDEFVEAFAKAGVVFTDDEIKIIFTRYATKLDKVINQINILGETK